MPGRRGVRLTTALATLLAVVATLPGPADAAASAVAPDPLSMTITSLTPASLPAKGPITIRGTVTNDAKTTWTGVRVYPFLDTDPITSTKQLAEQVAEPTDSFVGDRITDLPATDLLGDLRPGQTVHYRVTIARSDIDLTTNGAYWIGARAYGASDSTSDDNVADGRARTFLPFVKQGKNSSPVPVSLLLPVRARVVRTPSGRVADEAGWAADLSHGHLASVLDFGTTQARVTWLVDPAVLDAVRQLAAGNPGRDLAPSAVTSPPSPSASASPSTTSSSSPPVPTATPSSTSTHPFLASAMSAAQRWLRRFLAAIDGQEVLALPYGDPDLSAVAAHDPTLTEQARAESNAVMSELGIQAEPAAAPPNGYVDARGLALVTGGTTILSSQAVRDSPGPLVSLDGNRVDLTSAGADAGGPGPGNPYASVALRQRILAEAAVNRKQPLLVSLPSNWQAPTSSASFFAGLDVPWLALEPFTGATTGSPVDVPLSRLDYPRSAARTQVSAGIFPLVKEMIRLGDALEDVLVDHTAVADQVIRDALTSTSYSARGGHGNAARATGRALSRTLGRVHLSPPPAVTLSGTSGRFSVSVTNDLDQRVRVGIQPTSDAGITLHTPTSVIIGPNGSTSVLVTADVATNGVHHVLLRLTSPAGVPLGSTVELQIRSAQVSKVIWGFIGAGLGILAIAIAIRLIRRVRHSQTEA